MAEKLMLYYKYIQEELGLSGKLQLARETRIPSIRAAMEPDSPENIETFEKAFMKLTNKQAPKFQIQDS